MHFIKVVLPVQISSNGLDKYFMSINFLFDSGCIGQCFAFFLLEMYAKGIWGERVSYIFSLFSVGSEIEEKALRKHM